MSGREAAPAAGGRWQVGVIGDPVAHSLSPALQQPAFDALGMAATYAIWPTTTAALPDRIAGLRAANVLGANVTVPHKLAVMDLIDTVTPTARRAGAVNVIINEQGQLRGDNTDIAGFAAALTAIDPAPAARTTLILGAGGAARAVVLALESLGVEAVTLANRSPERAAALHHDLAPVTLRAIALDDAALRGELPRTTLLINATALGWHAGETPLPLALLDLLPNDAIVADLTYRDTDLLRAAATRGLRPLDGLPMLIHQGAAAFTLWTGRPAPLPVMRAAAETARAARERAG